MRTDRQTSMTQLKFVFHIFSKAPETVSREREEIYVCAEGAFIRISLPVIYVRKINSLYYVTPKAYCVCVCVHGQQNRLLHLKIK
jgi:hypothetical protein